MAKARKRVGALAQKRRLRESTEKIVEARDVYWRGMLLRVLEAAGIEPILPHSFELLEQQLTDVVARGRLAQREFEEFVRHVGQALHWTGPEWQEATESNPPLRTPGVVREALLAGVRETVQQKRQYRDMLHRSRETLTYTKAKAFEALLRGLRPDYERLQSPADALELGHAVQLQPGQIVHVPSDYGLAPARAESGGE